MNRVWYRLTGKSEEAIRRSIEISSQNLEVPMEELHELARILGQKKPVLQYGRDKEQRIQAYAVFPEIFAHPFTGRDEFYMFCPVGRTKDEEEAHFIPEDGVELDHEEADRLERILFMPHGQSVPIVSKEPILLRAEPPKSPGSGSP